MITIWHIIIPIIVAGLYGMYALATSKESRVKAVRRKYADLFAMGDNLSFDQYLAIKALEEKEIQQIINDEI